MRGTAAVVWQLFARAALFSLLIAELDVGLTMVSIPEWVARAGDAGVRASLANGMLGLVGVPSALLVALTGIAVSALGFHGNVSLVLLRGRHLDQMRVGPFAFVVGRWNPFRAALLCGLTVSGSLGLLAALRPTLIAASHTPTLVLIGVLVVCEVALSVWSVLWVITLRQTSVAVGELLSHGLNHMAYLGGLPLAHPLHPDRSASVARMTCAFDEERELEDVLLALGHTASHALAAQEPFAALRVLAALRTLWLKNLGTTFPAAWRGTFDTSELRQETWVEQTVVYVAGEVACAAIVGRQQVVADRALHLIDDLVRDRIRYGSARRPDNVKIIDDALVVYARCFELVTQTNQANIRQGLLFAVSAAFRMLVLGKWDIGAGTTHRLSTRVMEWRDGTQLQRRRLIQRMGRACTLSNEAGPLRAMLRVLEDTARPGTVQGLIVAEELVDMGAAAVAGGSAATAVALAREIVLRFDPEGSWFPAITRRSLLEGERSDDSARDRWVRTADLQAFVVLLVARAGMGASAWLRTARGELLSATAATYVDRRERRFTLARLLRAADVGDGELTLWLTSLDTIWPA